MLCAIYQPCICMYHHCMHDTDAKSGCLAREDQDIDNTIDSVQKSLSNVASQLDCLTQTVHSLHVLCVELREKYRLKCIAPDDFAPEAVNVEIVIHPETLPAALQKPEKPNDPVDESTPTTDLHPLLTDM